MAIQQIQADKLTSRINRLDIMMSWLHKEYAYETYVAIYCRTDLKFLLVVIYIADYYALLTCRTRL